MPLKIHSVFLSRHSQSVFRPEIQLSSTYGVVGNGNIAHSTAYHVSMVTPSVDFIYLFIYVYKAKTLLKKSQFNDNLKINKSSWNHKISMWLYSDMQVLKTKKSVFPKIFFFFFLNFSFHRCQNNMNE